jgi:hypothetical protein
MATTFGVSGCAADVFVAFAEEVVFLVLVLRAGAARFFVVAAVIVLLYRFFVNVRLTRTGRNF